MAAKFGFLARLLGRRSSQGFVGAGMIAVVVAAMGATLLGVGTTSRALNLYDGQIWFWSSSGEASRVHAATGKTNLRYQFADGDAEGMRLVQDDKHVLIHDPVTGVVGSLDLAQLEVTAAKKAGGKNVGVALWRDVVVMVDRNAGTLRRLNASTLKPEGDPLRLSKALVGGVFDSEGVLWAASPGDGRLYAVKPTKTGLKSVKKVTVAKPGSELALTTLDPGVAVVDKTAGKLVTVEPKNGSTSAVKIPTVDTCHLPEKSPEGIVVLTACDSRQIVLIDGKDVRTLDVPGEGKLGEAVVYNDRVFVADDKKHSVHVLDIETGKALEKHELPDAKGELRIEVIDGSLTINNENSKHAIVVGEDNEARVVDKAPPSVPKETPKVPETPAPQDQQPQQPSQPAPNPNPNPDPGPQNPGPADPVPNPNPNPNPDPGPSSPDPTTPDPTTPDPTTPAPEPPKTCQTDASLCTPQKPMNMPNFYGMFGEICDGCGGNTTQSVRLWQWILTLDGHPPNDGDGCDVDGDFQTATTRGTEGWQGAHGVGTDGRVGPDTWGAAQRNVTAFWVVGPDSVDPNAGGHWELRYRGVTVPGSFNDAGNWSAGVGNCQTP